MIAKKVHHKPVTKLLTEKVLADLAEGTSWKNTTPGHNQSAKGPTKAEIRIYKDGLLIAKGHATGIAPSRLSVDIDPLHFPVNSRLDIEFVVSTDRSTMLTRLSATVTSRSVKGIELRLDPASSR